MHQGRNVHLPAHAAADLLSAEHFDTSARRLPRRIARPDAIRIPAYDLGGCVADPSASSARRPAPAPRRTRKATALPPHSQRRPAGKRRQRRRLHCAGAGARFPPARTFTGADQRTAAKVADADILQPECRRLQRLGVRPGHPDQPSVHAARRLQHGQRRHRLDLPAQQFRLRHRQHDQRSGRLPQRRPGSRRLQRGCPTNIPTIRRHSAPLLHRKFGPVLRHAGRDRQRAVEWLWHGRMPEQERFHEVQVREVRPVPSHGPLNDGRAVPVHRHHRHARHAHLRGGNDQLRQLVRVLPHADPGRQDRVVDRVFVPGQHVPRRIPRSWHRRSHRGIRIWVDVNDFDLAQKTALVQQAVRDQGHNYSTFTMSAMLRIGNLFENGRRRQAFPRRQSAAGGGARTRSR